MLNAFGDFFDVLNVFNLFDGLSVFGKSLDVLNAICNLVDGLSVFGNFFVLNMFGNFFVKYIW